MPVDLPVTWSPVPIERSRAFSIKIPSLLVFMLILYALCFWAMIDAFRHDTAFALGIGLA